MQHKGETHLTGLLDKQAESARMQAADFDAKLKAIEDAIAVDTDEAKRSILLKQKNDLLDAQLAQVRSMSAAKKSTDTELQLLIEQEQLILDSPVVSTNTVPSAQRAMQGPINHEYTMDGFSPKETKEVLTKYSMRNVLDICRSARPEGGIEYQVSQEMEKQGGMSGLFSAGMRGTIIPFELLYNLLGDTADHTQDGVKRALTTDSSTAQMQSSFGIISPLFGQSSTVLAGSQIMSVPKGQKPYVSDFSVFPGSPDVRKITDNATALTDSTITIHKGDPNPARVIVNFNYENVYYNQFMAARENAVLTQSIVRLIGVGMEQLAVGGSGTNQPTGILNLTGVANHNFGVNGGTLTKAGLAVIFASALSADIQPDRVRVLLGSDGEGVFTTIAGSQQTAALITPGPNGLRLKGRPTYTGTVGLNDLTRGTSSVAFAVIVGDFQAGLKQALYGGGLRVMNNMEVANVAKGQTTLTVEAWYGAYASSKYFSITKSALAA